MIAGYNTDVRHADTVFHVQTEDKGTANPFIESLVYVGGRVLAAKRASYAALLADGKGSDAISGLMETQHRTVIAAIRQGKFDDKLHLMLGKSAAIALAVAPLVAAAAAAAAALSEPADVLAATKVTESETTLDQVILDYLTSEADREQLRLALEGEPALSVGLPSRLRLLATSSRSGEPVTGAHVDVKLISTVAEARTLATGETDSGGGLQLNFFIPELGGGAAALIITAASTIGSAELKHLL